jgi:membrane associated rhomboid family serine protease
MLPIHDDNPSGRTPWVTYGLIAANVLVFLYQLSLGDQALTRFFYTFAVVPKELVADFGRAAAGRPVGLLDFAPLFTSMFMHGGWMHLGGNMLFLYIFGDNVEDRLGHASYLSFYVLCGLAASLAHAWSGPASTLPSLGASGAIGGVLGAYIVLHPAARVTTLVFLGFLVTTLRVPAFVFLGVWFLMQSVQGLASLGAPSTAAEGGVAWWAHIGGFLVGMVGGAIGRALPARPSARRQVADRWYSNR